MKTHIDYGSDTAEEVFLKEALVEIERRYRQEAKPYLDRLVKIHAAKVPKVFIIPDSAEESAEMARRFGIDMGKLSPRPSASSPE